MNTITRSHCKNEIETDKALEGQIEARVLAAAYKEHEAEQKLLKSTSKNQIQNCRDLGIIK